MVEVALIDPDDNDWFEIDWTDSLPAGSTITSVTHIVPSPLVKVHESTTSPRSYVRIRGAEHGKTYLIQASAFLSDAVSPLRKINRQFPLRCFNG
jgi:hypothetical protein